MTHILPLICCYGSQIHHSWRECAIQQFGVSHFHAVKISHDRYYFCRSYVALYLVTFQHRSPFIQGCWEDVWYFFCCCFDSHGNWRPIVFSAVGVGQGTKCPMSFLKLFRCKMLNNTKESDSSFQCYWIKYTDVTELAFCPEQSASKKKTPLYNYLHNEIWRSEEGSLLAAVD